jgi:ATP-binding cassette subfamily C (CFTR/MRP) protein 10
MHIEDGSIIDNTAKTERRQWIHSFGSERSAAATAAFSQLLSICIRTYAGDFVLVMVLKCLIIGLGFVPVTVLNLLVTLLSEQSQSDSDSADFVDDDFLDTGTTLCVVLASSLVASAFANTIYTYRCTTLQLKLKGALTSILFSRAMSLPMQACNDLDVNDAKLATMVQVDVDRVSNSAQQFTDLWALPAQIILTVGYLYTQVNFAFLSGLVLYAIWLPVNAYISVLIGRAKKEDMFAKDKRLGVLTEALVAMKSVKLMGMEDVIQSMSDEKRAIELNWILRGRLLDAVCVLMWAVTPVIMPAVTFITCILLDQELSAATIFTTLTLLNFLIFPMNAFPWVLNGFIEARVSAKRIGCILWNASTENLQFSGDDDASDSVVKPRNSTTSLVLEDNIWSWLTKSDSDELPMFTIGPTPRIEIDCGVPRMICIYGRVASGKSSFVHGLLGEIGVLQNGKNLFSDCSLSYCPQQPFLHEGSIRSNIIFGQPYFPDRFRSIVAGCCLSHDISQMKRGDLYDVGKGGGNKVSGGQRLRIGIARALYVPSSCIILDDPFSALDLCMARDIYRFLTEHAKETKKVIIVCTQSVNLLREDSVDGIIHLFESYSSFRNTSFSQSFSAYDFSLSTASLGFREKETRISSMSVAWCPKDSTNHRQLIDYLDSKFASVSSDVAGSNDAKECDRSTTEQTTLYPQDVMGLQLGEDEEEESVKFGGISFKLYLAYFSSMGLGNTIALLVGLSIMQGTSDGINIWYGWWAAHFAAISTSKFVFFSSIIVGVNFMFGLMRSFSFARGGFDAAKLLYRRLSVAILGAEMSFFDKNSAGRVINRVGKDTSTIDYDLPFVLNNVLAQGFLTAGNCLVICISSPFSIPFLIGVIVFYHFLHNFFRYGARDLRRLEAITRSPLYTIICDCFADGPTIRCMKLNGYFEDKLNDATDHLNKVLFTILCANQWLSLRLQLLGSFVACTIATLAIILTFYGYIGHSATSFLAVSLSYSFTLTSRLNNLIRQMTLLEQEMVSVERVNEYIEARNHIVGMSVSLGSKEDRDLEAPLLPKKSGEYRPDTFNEAAEGKNKLRNWFPSRGEICIENLHLAYDESLPDVLKGISMKFPGGTRVAICGRSGSGKSTIFRLLTGLNTYHSGSCRIDGVELSTIHPDTLRRGLAVIPQDCLLLSGNLQLSLDPRNENSDEDIVHALDRISFAQTFLGLGNATVPVFVEGDDDEEMNPIISADNINNTSWLKFEVKNGGRNLSIGQRQLVCLARAVLQKRKIILVDEGTSSIDATTALSCSKILLECATALKCTLLVITHDLQSVEGCCDKVLTMNDGSVVDLRDL